MRGLGLFFALMGSLGRDATPARPTTGAGEAIEPLDDATYDAWEAWARRERRHADPAGSGVPARRVAQAPRAGSSERGVLGRI